MTVEIKGLDKVTASKKVLNEIALAFMEQSIFLNSVNQKDASKRACEAGEGIYHELSGVNYYSRKES